MLDALGSHLDDVVRPLVTLAFSGAMISGWLNGRLSDDAFLGVAGMVIGFWFQQRTATTNGTKTPAVKP